ASTSPRSARSPMPGVFWWAPAAFATDAVLLGVPTDAAALVAPAAAATTTTALVPPLPFDTPIALVPVAPGLATPAAVATIAFAAPAPFAAASASIAPAAKPTPLRFISDLHRARAVPERLIRHAELLEHREQQVRQWCLLRDLDVPVPFQLPSGAAGQH